MARSSRYGPEALLELARAAVAENPDVPVHAFRAEHGVGSNEAQSVLTAAKWERGHKQYGRLSRDQLHARYQNLVRAPDILDPTAGITIDAAPQALRAAVDRTLGAARDALSGIIDAMQAAARQTIANADARAADDIRAAESAVRDLGSEIEVAQRQVAEARQETAVVRGQFHAEISRLTQELRDQTRERLAAEAARDVAVEDGRRTLATMQQERDAMRQSTATLAARLADAERVAGAAERQVHTMAETIADLRRRLDEASIAVGEARRDASVAESRAAAADARFAQLQETHGGDMRMRAPKRTAQPDHRSRGGNQP